MSRISSEKELVEVIECVTGWKLNGDSRGQLVIGQRRDIDQDRDDAALSCGCAVVGMEYGRNNRGSEGAEHGDTCRWCPGPVDFLHSLSRSRTGGVIIIFERWDLGNARRVGRGRQR